MNNYKIEHKEILISTFELLNLELLNDLLTMLLIYGGDEFTPA